MTEKFAGCVQCKDKTKFRLHRQLFMNGSDHFLWVCSICQRKNPDNKGLYIAREKVEAFLSPDDIDNLPVIMPDLFNRCAVCGSRGTELHHWMPQALSPDANSWPKDYLCKRCHDKWHKIVTPGLVKEVSNGNS